MTTPSLVDRDPVVIAIGTEGTAPVLARQIKTQVEHALPQNLGGLAALCGRLRPAVTRHVERAKRRTFWNWVFSGEPRKLWDRGVETHAATMIKDAIRTGFANDAAEAGSLSIIDAGTGDPDLQTLRAVQRLQAADTIFFDRREDNAILELARRDAERVFLGDGQAHNHISPTWFQNRLTAAAGTGDRVVFITSRFGAYSDIAPSWRAQANAVGVILEFVTCAQASDPVGLSEVIAHEDRPRRAAWT